MPAPNKRISSKRSRTVYLSGSVLDVDSLPPSALCTTRQVADLCGFAEITLKVWRRIDGRGPKFVTVEGRPRYRVADVRDWLSSAGRTAASVKPANTGL